MSEVKQQDFGGDQFPIMEHAVSHGETQRGQRNATECRGFRLPRVGKCVTVTPRFGAAKKDYRRPYRASWTMGGQGIEAVVRPVGVARCQAGGRGNFGHKGFFGSTIECG